MAWPYAEDLTADFVYLRLHGSEELYTSGYSDEALDHWAARIKLWARGLEPNDARLIAPDRQPPRRNSRDVYVYFDNDAKVRAPVDARSLRAKVADRSQPVPPVLSGGEQDRRRAIATLSSQSGPKLVMAGLDPAIHLLAAGDENRATAWMRGSSPHMTTLGWFRPKAQQSFLFPNPHGRLLPCEFGNLMVVLPTGPAVAIWPRLREPRLRT